MLVHPWDQLPGGLTPPTNHTESVSLRLSTKLLSQLSLKCSPGVILQPLLLPTLGQVCKDSSPPSLSLPLQALLEVGLRVGLILT